MSKHDGRDGSDTVSRSVPPPGAHGGDGAAVARALGIRLEDVVDLSASLNPIAPDPAVIVSRHLAALGRYPDATAAQAALAETLGVPRERVVLTSGGAEAISLVGTLLGGRVEEPDFSLYPRGQARQPLDAEAAALAGEALPRWRSNPHSPTGTLAGPDASADVWDEAFWPLTTGSWSRGDDRDGAIIVGSLTKLLACPGLRVGYLVVPPTDRGAALAAAVRRAQPGWSVDGLVCSALPDLLASIELAGWSAEVAERRAAFVTDLQGRGFRVRDGVAPWLLVDDATLRDRLAPFGVVVRDCSSFGLPGTVRIALPTDRVLPTVLAAFDRIA